MIYLMDELYTKWANDWGEQQQQQRRRRRKNETKKNECRWCDGSNETHSRALMSALSASTSSKVESSKEIVTVYFSSLNVATHMPPLVHSVIVLLSVPLLFSACCLRRSECRRETKRERGENEKKNNNRNYYIKTTNHAIYIFQTKW